MKFKLGGPIVEERVALRLKELVSRFPSQVFHLGAIYGKAKQEFFDSLDVFVFPTLYPLEAQPNVLYEAMASGNIILATDRGCIGEMVPTWAGAVVADPSNFIEQSEAFIRASIEGQDLVAKKMAILECFAKERARASNQFDALINAMS